MVSDTSLSQNEAVCFSIFMSDCRSIILKECRGSTQLVGNVKTTTARLFIVAMVSTILQIPASANVEPSWRMIGRSAHILLFEKKYSEAIAGFQKAIDALPPAEKREDVRLDLLLAQAEAYRLWNHFSECGAILDEVKQELRKGEVYDPTLAARYWRRRADLMLSLGRKEELMLALRQQLAVTQKLFDPSSEHFLAVCEDMGNKLVNAGDLDSLSELLHDVCKRMPTDAKFQSIIAKRFRSLFDALISYVYKLYEENRMSKAKSVIVSLQETDPEKVRLGEVWLHYVGRSAMRRDVSFLSNDTADRIIALSRFYRQHPTVTNLHEEVNCHIALEYIYREAKQLRLLELQSLALASTIEKLLPNNATDFEKILLLDKYSNLTNDETVDKMSSTTALKMLRNMVEQSTMPPSIVLDNDHHRKAYLDDHVTGRLRLARLCSRLGMMEEAEKVFSSICEGPYDKEYPFPQTHVMLAEGFLEAGKISECKRHLQIAEQMGLSADEVVRANRIKARLTKVERAPK